MATLELSITARNAYLDAIDTLANGGTNPELRLYTGSTLPATCTTAASGTLVVKMALNGTNVFGSASSGTLTITGSPSGTGESGGPFTVTGTNPNECYFRIYDNNTGTASGGADAECVMQGDAGSAGGFALNLNNSSVATGQTVTITSFVLTAGNADQ